MLPFWDSASDPCIPVPLNLKEMNKSQPGSGRGRRGGHSPAGHRA